ncbi:uncharacterized protein CG7065 isoform X3 [Hermetia illucens]|nr:uncharacterized protein CG7065 isoform X3 [Hermetia illucens]
MPRLVQNICEAIEDHHGRLTLRVYDSTEFHKNRKRVLQDIIHDKHFTEKNGPTFTDIVDRSKIDEQLKAGKNSIAINIGSKHRDPSPPNVRAPKRDKTGNTVPRRQIRDNLDEISSSESDSPLKQRSPRYRTPRRDRSRSIERYGKKSRRSRSLSFSPPRRGGGMPRVHRSPPFDKQDVRKRGSDIGALSKQAGEYNQEKYKKDRYKSMLDNAIKELEKELKDHEKNPEKHPLYPEEWKTFWNRRYKELQAEKKDPNKYDYKPEWIVFWTKRMKELHLEAIEKRKNEIRKQCGLSTSPFKDKLEVIDISDEETSPLSVSPMREKSNSRYSREREREKERERERSHSRRVTEVSPDYYHAGLSREYHPVHPPQRYGVRYMDPDKYPKYEPENREEEEEDDGPLTVVAVLRLLTALEEQLGSLGPKVIDLLAKALALEKIKANSSDEMLLNEDTSVFFETVKEKFKGQILAGVLDSNKIKAVKKAIKNIAAILHQVTSKDKPSEEEKEPENPTKAKLLKTDILDRQLISSKLAAALVMQEKTDVSKEDMDRLINVFILIVKLSKERNSHVEVRDILLELGIETNVFDEEDLLSNISKVESKDSSDVAPTGHNASSSLDSLTDSDLQTLLQNFKHLSSEEQHHLIAHLKKLESTEPLRVEKLRKFVDVTDLKGDKSSPQTGKTSNAGISSFSGDEFESKKPAMIESDDDDDYNFDDVVKAASKNLSVNNAGKNDENQRADSVSRDPDREVSNLSMSSAASATTNLSLANTQNLIANLLGSLQQNTSKIVTQSTNTNIIPTIGSAPNRGQSFDPSKQPSSGDNFYSQSQPANSQQVSQQYPNTNQNFSPHPGNMFDHSYHPSNQIPQVQQPQRFAMRNANGPGMGNAMDQFNNPNMQNTPPNMQNSYFNQFNRNTGPQQQLHPGNYPPNPQQPNFFNHPLQNPGGFY